METEWNQGDVAYHPDWGELVVIDSNRDSRGRVRCRHTETDQIVDVLPGNLTGNHPTCMHCCEGRLEWRYGSFSCNNCGAYAWNGGCEDGPPSKAVG